MSDNRKKAISRHMRRHRRLVLSLAFICGLLVMSQCILIGGIAWVGKMRHNSHELNMLVEDAQMNLRSHDNERFREWLIEGGNYKNYLTMDEALRGYKEFGDEMRLRRARNAYKQEVLRLLKERGLKI